MDIRQYFCNFFIVADSGEALCMCTKAGAAEQILAALKTAELAATVRPEAGPANTDSLKLPQFEKCLDGISGLTGISFDPQWKLGAVEMYNYILRQLQA